VRSFGSGIVQGAGGLIGGVPSLAVEGTELGVFAAQNPGTTARRTPGAVADRAAALGQEARANPAEFGGTLVGSAALSGGLFRATKGTRAGGATRAAVQPGEELVKSGISRGLLGDRAATLTPGVSSNQIDAGSDATPSPTQPGNRLGSGGSGSLLDADAVDQARGTSGPSRTARARGRISRSDTVDRVQNAIAGEDRAQAQLTGRQRSQARDPEISDDRVTPNLYQQSVNNQLRRQQDAAEGGTFEGEGSPFGDNRRRAQAEQDVERLQRRQDRNDTTDTQSQPDAANSGLGAGGGVGVGLALNTDVGAGDRIDSPTTPTAEPDTPTDTRTDVGTETPLRTRDTEAETETAVEAEFEVGIEAEAGFESETGREASGSGERRFGGLADGLSLGEGGDEQRFEFETRDLL